MCASLAAASCIAALPLVLASAPAAAAAAAKPVLSVSGLPTGPIGGVTMPYTETGSIVDLHLSYKASLPKGAKLELYVRKSYTAPWVASKTPIKLAGGSAKIKVSSTGTGGPYSYEVAVVSGKTRLVTSKAIGLYWAQPPDGIFVEAGSESAFTKIGSTKEDCEAGCAGVGNPEETVEAAALAGLSPMPDGWTVTLVYKGEAVCTTKAITGECRGHITYPAVSAETKVPVTGEISSPSGKVTKATLLVTLYP